MNGMLGRERLKALLEKLSKRLERDGVRARMYLVGGALMALEFDRDRATWEEAARVADRDRTR